MDLLAVQGTLRSLLQHHSSKAPVLRCSAFFIIHLSHPYMTPGKTIALTIRFFVSKIMSLLFNMLYRFVIRDFNVPLYFLKRCFSLIHFYSCFTLGLCCFSSSSCRAGAVLHCVMWASHCSGFSCCGSQGLMCLGFSSCGVWP